MRSLRILTSPTSPDTLPTDRRRSPRTERPSLIRRVSTLALGACALAFAALPGGADAAEYPLGATIAISSRLCETFPVDPLDCPNAGGTGPLSATSYAGDVVLTAADALTHGGTLVWGEDGSVPITGYNIDLSNMQAFPGYAFSTVVAAPGIDGGAGVYGPYIHLTAQQPGGELFLVFVADGTSTAVLDSDGDGFGNDIENSHGTDPFDPADVPTVEGSNLDSDGDGASDALEIDRGSDPFDPYSFPTTQAGNYPDADGDGISDQWEGPNYGTDPYVADSDGDGLGDGEEAGLGTDPLAADTDGDGAGDAEEVAFGSNPFDAADFPAVQAGPEADAGGDTDGDAGTDDVEAASGSGPNAPVSKPASSVAATGGSTAKAAKTATAAVTALPNTGAGPNAGGAHDSLPLGMLLALAGAALTGAIAVRRRIA